MKPTKNTTPNLPKVGQVFHGRSGTRYVCQEVVPCPADRSTCTESSICTGWKAATLRGTEPWSCLCLLNRWEEGRV